MENLRRRIYHEKQQAGSMLCAQHALNSLLQESYFTAPDLSDIGRSLDDAERSVRDAEAAGRNPTSANMDDTGFFSVQVLENALKIWGLTLVRWRSEELRPFQDAPELQNAFILNLEQHWFTIRRFGNTEDNFHWFNLNSFLKLPELVSSTYLGMVLQQAEQEGYSVFAVRPVNDETSSSALPQTEADLIASTIPPSNSYSLASQLSTGRNLPEGSAEIEAGFGDLGDEDLELQRALQASLLGGEGSHPINPTNPTPSTSYLTPAQHSEVEASRARQKAILDRAKMEQEMATREIMDYSENLPTNTQKRTTGAEEEEEMLRKAMEESLAEAESARNTSTVADSHTTTGEASLNPPQTQPSAQAPTYAVGNRPRVLDDEDEELQAALRASLADGPSEFTIPPSPPRHSAGTSATTTGQSPTNRDGSIMESPPASPQIETVSVDELRRKRLERFGG